jgi:hypothetical protein
MKTNCMLYFMLQRLEEITEQEEGVKGGISQNVFQVSRISYFFFFFFTLKNFSSVNFKCTTNVTDVRTDKNRTQNAHLNGIMSP